MTMHYTNTEEETQDYESDHAKNAVMGHEGYHEHGNEHWDQDWRELENQSQETQHIIQYPNHHD